jgi:O-antigen/teichoic acid export membrane protein
MRENIGVTGIRTFGSRLRYAAITSAWAIVHRSKASVGFAFLDQGTTSFANFAQLVIAARVLPIDELGNYSIVWALSLLVTAVATALTVDPLPAITSLRRPSMRIPIIAAAARLNLLIGCVLATLILICGLIIRVWSPTFAVLLFCLAIASPMQQMQYASRRFCYLLRRQGVAAASAAAYAIVLVGGVIGLWATELCTASGLILLSGAASLAASAVGGALGCLPVSKVRPKLQKWLTSQCWRTGKWLASSSIIIWMKSVFLIPIAASIFGPSSAGILRAYSTIFMPVYQFMWAMGSLLVPHMAEVGAKQSANRLRGAALLTVAGFVTVATAFSVVVLVFGSDLLTLVYNKPEITGASRLLRPFAIGSIVDAINTGIAIVLMANGITRPMFWAPVASVAVFLSGALSLGSAISLNAMVWVLIIANAVATIVLVSALVRTLHRPTPSPLA